MPPTTTFSGSPRDASSISFAALAWTPTTCSPTMMVRPGTTAAGCSRAAACGATSGGEATINLRLIFFKLLSILGSTMGSLAELHEIMKFVESGRLHPVIDRILPISEVAEGHRILEAREAFGKIVLVP